MGGNISSNQAGRLETADVERYPADGVTPLGSGVSPVPAERPEHETEKDVTFAIGGGADCAAPCADRALAGIGPDVWLKTALEHAHQVAGVRAFLYTGPYVTAAKVNGPRSLPVPFAKELAEYKSILGAAGPLPVYPAISPQELNARPEREGTEQSFFEAGLSPLEPLAGETAVPGELRQSCLDSVGCEADYYAFDSTGAAGTVRVIVLDDSSDVEQAQLEWLEQELEGAKRSAEAGKQPLPAIVIGNADLGAQVAAGDQQAARVVAALVGGAGKCRENREPCGASAYFYDSPEENVKKPLRSGGESIEEIGSGTLGYVNAEGERYSTFHGAGGFLLGQVEMAEYEESNNRAPVTPRLIPDISELALEAHSGTLLRRSEPALFAGLARRPRARWVAPEPEQRRNRSRSLHSHTPVLRRRSLRYGATCCPNIPSPRPTRTSERSSSPTSLLRPITKLCCSTPRGTRNAGDQRTGCRRIDLGGPVLRVQRRHDHGHDQRGGCPHRCR